MKLLTCLLFITSALASEGDEAFSENKSHLNVLPVSHTVHPGHKNFHDAHESFKKNVTPRVEDNKFLLRKQITMLENIITALHQEQNPLGQIFGKQCENHVQELKKLEHIITRDTSVQKAEEMIVNIGKKYSLNDGY